jgi:HSP20 family molecular chaperone IbpA
VAGSEGNRRWIAVLRFDPFSDLDALTRGLLTSQSGSNRIPRFMPMDLCKIDDHYVLTADLPGVDPGSVDVNVDNGTLTISAHRTARSEDAVQWLTNERFFAPTAGSWPSARASTRRPSPRRMRTAC